MPEQHLHEDGSSFSWGDGSQVHDHTSSRISELPQLRPRERSHLTGYRSMSDRNQFLMEKAYYTGNADGDLNNTYAGCPEADTTFMTGFDTSDQTPQLESNSSFTGNATRHMHQKLPYKEGAPISDYEIFINTERHPKIVGRNLPGGYQPQNPPDLGQSNEPSANSTHRDEWRSNWTEKQEQYLWKLGQSKTPELLWDDIAEMVGDFTAEACRHKYYRMRTIAAKQARRGKQ